MNSHETEKQVVPVHAERWIRQYESSLGKLIRRRVVEILKRKQVGEKLTAQDMQGAVADGYQEAMLARSLPPDPDPDKMQIAMREYESGEWNTPDQILREMGFRQ